MRNRIAKIIGALGDHDDLRSFGQFIEREQGILVGQTVYSYQWPPILQKMELRDVLDTITTIYSAISSYDQGREAQKRKTFLDNCRRVFAEEQVRYRSMIEAAFTWRLTKSSKLRASPPFQA